jgi:hypothetical protein
MIKFCQNIIFHLNFFQVTEASPKGGSVAMNIQVISAMPQYENKSFEELRLEDYRRNNKGGTSLGMNS